MKRPMWTLGLLLAGLLISRGLEAQAVTLGGEFQVNTFTTSYQYDPSVAVEPGGDFVVVWTSDGSGDTDSSSYSIQGQRFETPLFADGFESGDTSAWSATEP